MITRRACRARSSGGGRQVAGVPEAAADGQRRQIPSGRIDVGRPLQGIPVERCRRLAALVEGWSGLSGVHRSPTYWPGDSLDKRVRFVKS